MRKYFCRYLPAALCVLAATLCGVQLADAQQTLGSLNGTVMDVSGASIGGATVTVVSEQTGLTRSTASQSSGYWEILNLPVGTYKVTVTQQGFQTTDYPGIVVQENRATTINASLKPGKVSESVTVTANPLLNATDTTNGYTLDKAQIDMTPLATGSFTQLAILAPGVSAELLSGTGTNAGLGNQPIWANGQRDTSNTFQVNGISVVNLFNGKSSSESTSQRLNFNIGENTGTGGSYQTDTSVYGSNGNGLASPPPEFMQEVSVNTSMYDAQQGQTSGAHVDINTASGGNAIHGQIYGVRGTNWLNANPFFYDQDVGLGILTPSQANPQLHRFVAGGTVGGPIKKDKLFYFLGYQHEADDDQYPYSQLQVPFGLSSDRSATGITTALQSYYTSSKKTYKPIATYDKAAMAIFGYCPNGQCLIPSPTMSAAAAETAIANGLPDVFLASTSTFKADQATAALDYNASSSDHLSAKYYYQHTPVSSPFGMSKVPGFTQDQDTGAQTGALNNSLGIGSKINWEQRIGFSRQKVYMNYKQGVGPDSLGISLPAGVDANKTPGFELADFACSSCTEYTPYVGPYSAFVNAGYFENRIAPLTDAIFTLGAHTVSVGASFSYDQLNIRNEREGNSEIELKTLPSILAGKLYKGTMLLGDSNRYYRSHDIGAYVQDKWQARPNLSITGGLRYDFDGPFSEKYGNLFNFDPSLYSATASAVTNSGFVVAGNNKQYATPGVSASTLKGRQWGFAPRVGIAWSPGFAQGKQVVRAGYGLYYDRGEYFQYLSPPAGQGISGPFGVTEEAPLASYINVSGTLDSPFGSGALPTGESNPSIFNTLLPTVNDLLSECTTANVYNATSATEYDCAAIPYVIGNYNDSNVLPYAEQWMLDWQWQPRNDLSVDLGYAANRGKHAVIPVPFNEPKLATPSNQVCPLGGSTGCQSYSYGYQVLSQATNSSGIPNNLSTEPMDTYSGGNVDLRVPYIGYDPNSTSFETVGISSYDALQAHLEKRMSYGIQVGASYTYSHTLDEQSDIGLFFTGDNPDNLRSSYATSDYDRTHILTFNYLFQEPNLIKQHNVASYFVNGWALVGLTVLQSGQPYSIYDYSGSVGSQYFGTNIEELNPVLPLAPGIRPKQALTGHVGAYGQPALNPQDFEIPLVSPGANGVPQCDATGGPDASGGTSAPLCDVYETSFVPGQRNIFRQAFQKRADITLQKLIPISERYSVRYRFEMFNVTNTPSFDIPTNEITLDPNYGELNGNDAGTQVQPNYSTSVTTPKSSAATCVGNSQNCAYELFTTPGSSSTNLGVVKSTIGGPRVIQMSLHIMF